MSTTSANLSSLIQKPLSTLSQQDVFSYLHAHVKQNFSSDYINQIRAALCIFFRAGLQQPLDESLLPRVRKETVRPSVLSQSEIKLILSHIKNPRHKVILFTCNFAILKAPDRQTKIG